MGINDSKAGKNITNTQALDLIRGHSLDPCFGPGPDPLVINRRAKRAFVLLKPMLNLVLFLKACNADRS